MAIQMRRGEYDDFDASKMLAGELAVVVSGDPETEGGALYVATAAGSATRVAFANEIPGDATTTSDGLMSAADKAKLDGVAAGAQANVIESVSVNGNSATVTGKAAAVTIPEATDAASGVMGAGDKAKLDGIAEGANAYTHPSYTARTGQPTANQTPAFGDTFSVSQVTSDTTGHVTGLTARTVKIPDAIATSSAAGLMSAADKARFDEYVESATGYRPVKDAATGRYTNASLAMWLMTLRNGKKYGTLVPKGAESVCTKSRANAGIANPTPGYVGTPAIDPYDDEGGAFLHFDVNGGADPDGTPFVTKIRGIDDDFALDGSQGDVWVLAPALWWRWDASNELYSEMVISDSPLPGLWAQPNAYLPSGQIRPYMLYAKYGGGKGEDGKMHSYSGLPLWIRQVSHNTTITQCQTATTGYSGKTTADDWYVKTMFLSKYATKDSQSVFTGCMSYNYQYAPAVAETGARRVVLTNAQAANLIVGSSMMLGTSGSTDRQNAACYDVFDGAVITSIEAYDESHMAVYFDTLDTFDVETTYLLSTSPWGAGCLDAVDGDGTVTAAGATSSKEPFKIQGIECQLGAYEVLGNVILDNAGDGFEVCVNHDTRGESTSLTSAYVRTGIVLPTSDADAWHYTLTPTYAGGALVAVNEGTSAQGTHDGTYTNKLSTIATREFLSGGYLYTGATGGLWCVYGTSSLGHAWWRFASRLSAIGRSGGEFRAA